MKKLLATLAVLFTATLASLAQNDKADNILGKYQSVQNGDSYKVQISKKADGSYKAQIYWVKDSIDPKTGSKALDVKNPDKSLRSVPCDRIVLIDGVRYNAEKKQWDGAKIYDPQRGIRANATISFSDANTLKVKGSVLGISETATWTRVQE